MAPLAKTLVSLFLFSALAVASPVQSERAHGTRSSTCDGPDQGGDNYNHNNNGTTGVQRYSESFPAEIHYIYPNHPEKSKIADGIHLESWEDASQIEQVSVFKIPAGAKNCYIARRAQGKLDRTFVVRTVPGANRDSSCMSDVRQVSEIRRPVTYANMQSLLDVTKPYTTMMEWASWDMAQYAVDKPEVPPAMRGKPVECTGEIYMWERLRNVTNEKTVYMKGEGMNGWYINFDLEH